jgi:hypothetical protein
MAEVSSINTNFNNSNLLKNYSVSSNKKTNVSNIKRDFLEHPKDDVLKNLNSEGLIAGTMLGKNKVVDITNFSVEEGDSFISSALMNLPKDGIINVQIDGVKFELTRSFLEDYQQNSIQKDSETGGYVQMSLQNFLFKKYPSTYFYLFGNTYGCDQGGIESLVYYELNGKKYTYRQYKNYIDMCKRHKRPIPHFKERTDSIEYLRLRSKLIHQGFSSKEAAIILKSVNDVGACTYATTVNTIITSYIGKEEEFEQKFGFPMYKVENGKKILNSNELLLDLYVYANSEENGGKFFTKDNKLSVKELTKAKDSFNRQTLKGMDQQFMRYEKDVKDKNDGYYYRKAFVNDVIKKYLRSKDVDYHGSAYFYREFDAVPVDSITFKTLTDNIQEQMKQGKVFDISFNDTKGSSPINMLSTTDKNDKFSSKQMRGMGHSVFITGIRDNFLYVSSWGKEYKIPFSDLKKNSEYYIYVSEIS